MNFDSRSGIYKIERTSDGKAYVGSAISLSRRKITHWRDLRRGNHVNRKLQNAWNKYGEGAFAFFVLEFVEDKSRLIEREQVWIEQLGSAKVGFNLAPAAGSILGMKFSAESRDRMSLAAKGKAKSAAHVAAVTAALKGRKMTPEQCEKMRIAKLGKKMGPRLPEWRAKIAAGHKGQILTPEHIAAIRLAAEKRRGQPWSADRRAAYERRKQGIQPPT